MDALVDLIVSAYAPLPVPSLTQLVGRLQWAAPQWATDRKRALAHAVERLPRARVAGIDWLWPAGEDPASPRHQPDDRVYLLAPFDPVVWDRRRFELFWGWPYRFEAYVPAARRKHGYYALPVLWREAVIGWTNVSVRDGCPIAELGFVERKPTERAFAAALEAELEALQRFLPGASAARSPARDPSPAHPSSALASLASAACLRPRNADRRNSPSSSRA